ncbi:MAG: extracellular solute-binding protein [Thermosphaera sp.]
MKRALFALLVVLAFGLAVAQQTEVRVIAFAQGFAWPELFGESGTEKTDLLREFEEREGITVTIEWGDETAVRQKVLTDLISGAGRYDVILLGSDGAVQTYGFGGFLEPLDEHLASGAYDKYFNDEDIYPQFLDANRIDGVLYGLPYYSFGPGIIYRTDLFDRYSIEVPTTTDELEAALERLKEGFVEDGITDVYPLTMRGAPGEEPSLDLAGFVYAYAGYPAWFEGGATSAEEIREARAQPIFTGDFRPGFEAFVRLARDYGPPGISTHTWVDMMNLYAQGRAAVLLPSAINGYAAITFTENEEVRENSAFAPIVKGPSGERIQSFWTFSLGVPQASQRKEAALTVLTFLTGQRAMQAFADRTQWPSVTMPSVMHSEVLINRWGEAEIRLNEEAVMLSNPFYFPYIPELAEFMDRIGTAASRAISTGDVDAALNELQTWALERMHAAGYYR